MSTNLTDRTPATRRSFDLCFSPLTLCYQAFLGGWTCLALLLFFLFLGSWYKLNHIIESAVQRIADPDNHIQGDMPMKSTQGRMNKAITPQMAQKK